MFFGAEAANGSPFRIFLSQCRSKVISNLQTLVCLTLSDILFRIFILSIALNAAAARACLSFERHTSASTLQQQSERIQQPAVRVR